MGPNREQLVRPQVWRTSLGVDMESEKKRQPGQSPGEHQLMRTAADKGPAKETEGAAREPPVPPGYPYWRSAQGRRTAGTGVEVASEPLYLKAA